MPAVRAVSSNSGTGTTATGNRPTGTADGDLLVAYIVGGSASPNITGTPSGWAQTQGEQAGASKDFSGEMHTKTAASEPASWDWTWSASVDWRVIVVAISDPHATTPINTSHAEDLSSGNTIAIGAMTPTVDGCLLLWCGLVDASGGARTWTADGAPTEQLDSMAAAIHAGVYSETQTTAAGITRSLTVSGSAQYMLGFGIAVAPAAGGGGGGESLPPIRRPLYIWNRVT